MIQLLKKINYRSFEKILFFLLILLLPTQFGRHFFFDFSYLSGVRVDYLAPTIYVVDILVIALAALNWKLILNFFKNRKLLFVLALFIINVFFAHSIFLAFYRFIKIIEFLVLIAITNRFVRALRAKLLLLTLTLGAFTETILAAFQLIYKHSIQGIFYFLGERYFTLSTPGIAKGSLDGIEILRPYGTFSHPNSMAGFYLVLYFFVLFYKPFNSNKTLRLIFLFLSIILIFISFSKVAIITFILLNFLYFLRKINKEKVCKLCLIPKILIPLSIAFIFLSFKSDPLSVAKRIELAKNSLMIISENWLLGVGGGNYLIIQDKFPSHYPYFFEQPVHNIFLLFLSEMGIVISLFIFIEVYKFFKINKKKEVFLFIFIAVIITGFFDHYWLTLEQNFVLFAVIVGFL